MTKNLIGIIISILFGIIAALSNYPILKIIGTIILIIAGIFAIMWTIGHTLEKRKEKQNKK